MSGLSRRQLLFHAVPIGLAGLAIARPARAAGSCVQPDSESLRASLERRGVTTDDWWDAQVGLCLLGALVQFGWEKALGDDDELGWWCDRASEGLALL